MQIVNLSTEAILHLAEAATRAIAEGRTFRVAVHGDSFKYKVGEGMWSPPLHDQPDPYRDRFDLDMEGDRANDAFFDEAFGKM